MDDFSEIDSERSYIYFDQELSDNKDIAESYVECYKSEDLEESFSYEDGQILYHPVA